MKPHLEPRMLQPPRKRLEQRGLAGGGGPQQQSDPARLEHPADAVQDDQLGGGVVVALEQGEGPLQQAGRSSGHASACVQLRQSGL